MQHPVLAGASHAAYAVDGGPGAVEPRAGRRPSPAARDGRRRTPRRAGPPASRRTRRGRRTDGSGAVSVADETPGSDPSSTAPTVSSAAALDARTGGGTRGHRSQGAQACFNRNPDIVSCHAADAPLVVGFDLDMTLIDTVPGSRRRWRCSGPRPGSSSTSRRSAAGSVRRSTCCWRRTTRPTSIAGLVDRFREHYPDHAIAPTAAFPGAHEALAAVRRHAGRSVMVTGKYRPTRAPRRRPRPGRRRTRRRGLGGRARAAVLSEHGATVYVGDHVHDVEGAHAAGSAQRLGADRRLHRAGAARRRHRRGAARPDRVPRAGSTPTCSTRGWPRSRSSCARWGRCWWPSAGERTARSCWPRRSAPSGAEHVGAATAYSDSLPAERALARPGVRRGARGRGCFTPETARDGARGLPRQRRRPLLLLQGRAARRARAARRGARLRGRRDRDQRRRRRGRVPARASGRPPSAVR